MKATIVDTYNTFFQLELDELQEIIDKAGGDRHKTTTIDVKEDDLMLGELLVVYTGDVEPDLEDVIEFLNL